MNILFLIGLEGSGHHLFKNACSFNQESQLHWLIAKYFSPNHSEYRDKTKSDIYDYVNNRNSNYIERSSFPHGTNLLRHNILEFDSLFSPIANVFYIICYRDIKASTFSSWRRFNIKGSPITTCKIQEENLFYIMSQVSQLDKSKYIIVDYENICDYPEAFEKHIQYQSGFKSFYFNESKIRKSNKLCKAKEINEYFDDQKLSQFSFISNGIKKFS